MHDDTPIVEAIRQYVSRKTARLHFPGHKGRALSASAREMFGEALANDLTELPGLDDLHAPSGAILEAESLAARAFGASRTFFLVGGASAGIVASVWAGAAENESVALPRNSHRSAVSALLMSGARPIWIPPGVDKSVDEHGSAIAAGLAVGTRSTGGRAGSTGRTGGAGCAGRMGIPLPCPLCALSETGATLALALSPTYDGLCCDFTDPVRRELSLVVDEAHGSHFYFSSRFPQGALRSNKAHAVVHGAHKSLGSLTGTGLLHLTSTSSGSKIASRAPELLSCIQTSSPSYLMMASLDLARRDMEECGERLMAQVAETARDIREGLRSAGVQIIDPEKDFGCSDYDPSKVIVPSTQFGLSGGELLNLLFDEGVAVEYAGLLHVTAALGPGSEPEDGRRFVEAVLRVRDQMGRKTSGGETPRTARLSAAARAASSVVESQALWHIPVQAMTPRSAMQARHRVVPLRYAIGKVAAENWYIYPPGSPVLVQGEIVPAGFAEFAGLLRAAGVHFHGPKDVELETLHVVEES